MSLFVDPPFALGQTLGVTSATDGENWVGVVKVFPDVNPLTGKVRSNKVKTCVAVRNSSGSTLYGKRAVAYAAGSSKAVSGYARVTNAVVAGVSDEYLPASGVAANDVFWATVEGPTELITSTEVVVDGVVAAVTAHTTNATDTAGTGGHGATVSVTVAPQVGRIGRVTAGTTGTVSINAAVVRV